MRLSELCFGVQDLRGVSLFSQATAVVRLSKLPAFKELQAHMKFNRKVSAITIAICLTNRSFPSCPCPLFQNESWCKTIQIKMRLICMKMNLWVELGFISKVLHQDSF